MRIIEGTLDASGLRIGLVAARFNGAVVSLLVDGAIDCVARHGGERDAIELVWVPGSWELPVATAALARSGRVDAIVALGAVVRGETAHFDYVSSQAAEVGRVALDTGIPVANAVLTTETYDQAVARSGGTAGNKGWEAAASAIETARVLARISGSAATT